MRVGCYFARAVAGWFFALTALTVAVVLAWSMVLPVPRSGLPAPWAMMGPLFLAACWITWRRAQRAGELHATAASGVGGWMVFVPVCGLGLLLQVLFALPAGGMPATRTTSGAVQRSVDGQLFLAHGDYGVLLDPQGVVRVQGAGLPAGFKPAPHNPGRYRRQAFYTQSPRWPPRDPLDPWLWRGLYALCVAVVPAWLMLAQRPAIWWLGAVTLLIPLAIL